MGLDEIELWGRLYMSWFALVQDVVNWEIVLDDGIVIGRVN